MEPTLRVYRAHESRPNVPDMVASLDKSNAGGSQLEIHLGGLRLIAPAYLDMSPKLHWLAYPSNLKG